MAQLHWNRPGRRGNVRQAQSGESIADEGFELGRRAGFEQLWGALDQLRVADVGRDGQVEAGTLEVGVLVDGGCIDGIPDHLEGERNEVAGNHRLQHEADEAVQLSETGAKLLVVVRRQVTGRDLAGEGGQRSRQVGELIEEHLGLNIARFQEVAKHGQMAVDGVKKPEIGYVGGSEVGQGLVLLAAAAGQLAAAGHQ